MPRDKAKYVARIGLKLTQEERDRLQAFASARNMNISAAARVLLNEKIAPARGKNFGDSEAELSVKQAIGTYRESFRKLVENFAKLVDLYSRGLDVKDRNGQPRISTASTVRDLFSMNEKILKMQQLLSDIARAAGLSVKKELAKDEESRIRNIVAAKGTALPSAETAALPEAVPEKYTTMWKTTFIGVLSGAAELYTDSTGNEMMRLSLLVTSFLPGGKATTKVDVIKKKYNIYQYLTDGKKVVVSGDVDIRTYSYNGHASEAALTVWADTLTLS